MLKNVPQKLNNLLRKNFTKEIFCLDTFKKSPANELLKIINDQKEGKYNDNVKIEILNKYERNSLTSSTNIIAKKYVNPFDDMNKTTLTKLNEDQINSFIDMTFKKKQQQSKMDRERLFAETKLEEMGEPIPDYRNTTISKYKQSKHIINKEPDVTKTVELTFKEFDEALQKLKSKTFVEDNFFDNDLVAESNEFANNNLSFLDKDFDSDDEELKKIKVDVKSLLKETEKSVKKLLENDNSTFNIEDMQQKDVEVTESSANNSPEFIRYLNNLKYKDNNFVQRVASFFAADMVI
jgi:hypothetical protein